MISLGRLYRALSYSTLFLFPLAAAQYSFTIPIPGVVNFHAINDLTQGEITEFAWRLNSTHQKTISGDPIIESGNISLWITSYRGLQYTRCLDASVNSQTGGTHTWEIDLTDEEIDEHEGQFVYRLKPPVVSKNTPYDKNEPEAPSRGFRILKKVEVATVTVSNTATATNGASEETSTADSTTTENNGDGDGGGGLSAGAKGGIAAGAAVGGILIIAAGALFWWRRRANSHGGQVYEDEGEKAAPGHVDTQRFPSELPSSAYVPELEGGLDGNGGRGFVHEIGPGGGRI